MRRRKNDENNDENNGEKVKATEGKWALVNHSVFHYNWIKISNEQLFEKKLKEKLPNAALIAIVDNPIIFHGQRFYDELDL